MIKINVNGSVVSVQETEALYSGSADVHTCHFEFDTSWESFTKTAVFRVGEKAITALVNDENACVLPWELLTRSNIGLDIEVGVYGVSAEAEVMTGVWDTIGPVREGTELGNDAREPSEGIYEQITANVKKIDDKVISYNEHVQTQVQRAESAATIATSSAASAEQNAGYAAVSASALASELAGVKNALENLPEGTTIIVNDLTTGGAGAALSAEMGRALNLRSGKNILINSNFTKAINQRARFEHSGSGYTADCWQIRRGSTTFECLSVISEQGIRLENGAASSTAFLTQHFETTLPAGTYTLSALVEEVAGTVRLCLYSGGTNKKNVRITEPGLISFTVSLTPDENIDSLRITAAAGSSFTIKAVKLESGITQSLAYRSEDGSLVFCDHFDYSEELLKCQRYYQLFSSEDKVPSALIDYRPAMRANPKTGTIDIDGVTYYFADASED